MRIGYCSPFNPMKTGISDFSEELVVELAQYADVIVFSPVKPEKKEILENFEVHLLDELDQDELRNSLDVLVYHIGNNVTYHGAIVDKLEKYPGIVELHELGLHHLAAAITLERHGQEAYLEAVRFSHGERGVQIAQSFFEGKCGAPWNDHALDMCMARPIIEHATGVIVHAETLKQMVLGIRPDVPVVSIMLHALMNDEDTEIFRKKCRKRLNLPEKTVVIGAFGFATSAKRVVPSLDALERVKNAGQEFLFTLVGEVQPEIDIDLEIQKRNLQNNVLVTGYTTLEEFKDYMGACDFCLNLRYPTQGESSASLHRMMGMGKPAIVTDIGTFSDYPENIADKVRYDENEVEDIYQAIMKFLTHPSRCRKMGKCALEFARDHCDLKKNTIRYVDFFTQIANHTWQADEEDLLIGKLCELGLTDEEYLRHVYQQIQGVIE